MSEIVSKTILQIKEGLKKREYSALEVTDAFISASESNKKLNFFQFQPREEKNTFSHFFGIYKSHLLSRILISEKNPFAQHFIYIRPLI